MTFSLLDDIQVALAKVYLNPFTTVTLACFVPPLFLFVQLVRKFNTIGACVAKAYATIDCIARSIQGKAKEVADKAAAETHHNPMVDVAMEEGEGKVMFVPADHTNPVKWVLENTVEASVKEVQYYHDTLEALRNEAILNHHPEADLDSDGELSPEEVDGFRKEVIESRHVRRRRE